MIPELKWEKEVAAAYVRAILPDGRIARISAIEWVNTPADRRKDLMFAAIADAV